MKKALPILICIAWVLLFPDWTDAQCSMCTKTASQLGEKPALGLNNGILYLMLAPFTIILIIGYRWWKHRDLN